VRWQLANIPSSVLCKCREWPWLRSFQPRALRRWCQCFRVLV